MQEEETAKLQLKSVVTTAGPQRAEETCTSLISCYAKDTFKQGKEEKIVHTCIPRKSPKHLHWPC
jgi:hypothetical protein